MVRSLRKGLEDSGGRAAVPACEISSPADPPCFFRAEQTVPSDALGALDPGAVLLVLVHALSVCLGQGACSVAICRLVRSWVVCSEDPVCAGRFQASGGH